MDSKDNILDDENAIDNRQERPLGIKIICFIGMLMSLLDIAGTVYVSLGSPMYENKWTILLKLVIAINLLCWLGFWFLRKATLVVYIGNCIFSIWLYQRIGVSPFSIWMFFSIVVILVVLANLHRMHKWI